MSRARVSERTGFTLAEVLVALFILAVAVLGLVSVHIYSLRSMVGNQARNRASVLAFDALSHAEVQLLSSDANFQKSVSQPLAAVPGVSGYTMVVADQLVSPTLKQVAVTVYFPDPQAGTREYDVSTFVYNKNH